MMNFYIDYTYIGMKPVIIGNTSVNPSQVMKFLGIFVDDHLTFSSHVDEVAKSCNSKIFLMRQLKNKVLSAMV